MCTINKNQIEELQRCDSEQFVKVLNRILKNEKAIVMFIKNLYSFATTSSYTSEQKHDVVNLSIDLLQQIPLHQVQKIAFVKKLEERVFRLSKRIPQKPNPQFSQKECVILLSYLKNAILPYYDFYQNVLQSSQYFQMKCTIYDPAPTLTQIPIPKAKLVDVDSIQILKQFIGIRLPKETKVEAKKK